MQVTPSFNCARKELPELKRSMNEVLASEEGKSASNAETDTHGGFGRQQRPLKRTAYVFLPIVTLNVKNSCSEVL